MWSQPRLKEITVTNKSSLLLTWNLCIPQKVAYGQLCLKIGLWLIRDQDHWDEIFCVSFVQYQSIFFKLVYRGGPRELDCISSSQCNLTNRMQQLKSFSGLVLGCFLDGLGWRTVISEGKYMIVWLSWLFYAFLLLFYLLILRLFLSISTYTPHFPNSFIRSLYPDIIISNASQIPTLIKSSLFLTLPPTLVVIFLLIFTILPKLKWHLNVLIWIFLIDRDN